MSNRPLLIRKAAELTGLSPRRVREICETHSIGEVAIGGTRILRESDIAKINAHRRPVGNPNFRRRKSKGE